MLPKRKKIIVLTAVLIAALSAFVFLISQRGPTIPEEEAIARVRDYFEEWEDIKIIKTELRPPTEQEKSFIRSDGREPPSLVWVVEAHLKECFGTDQHGNVFMLPYGVKVLLNAYTGEILSIAV